jgi:hypothetical protein
MTSLDTPAATTLDKLALLHQPMRVVSLSAPHGTSEWPAPLDLPGVHSLNPRSPDETVTAEALCGVTWLGTLWATTCGRYCDAI